MTGSQIKQEAPETNTFEMAEIEADDQWSLRSTMQGARIWLPNIEEFFTSLGRLLVTGGDWTQTLCVACRMKLTTNES